MKWPVELTLVRHAQSEYNLLKGVRSSNPLYVEFKAAYEEDHRSERSRELAARVQAKFALNKSDANTNTTIEGFNAAIRTGEMLKSMIGLPHVVFVSPYLRTKQTLVGLREGWTELNNEEEVSIVSEDRIREQEHGLALLYNDWRVFHVMHPEQKALHALQGPYWYQYPQGESVSQVRDRIRSFLDTLTREYAGKRVLLVTHHLTILSIRATLERLTPAQFIELDEKQKPINCGVTVYHGDAALGRNGRLVLSDYNVKLF